VLVVRATLVSQARRTLIAQRTFTIERTAASADAIGGVHALVAASDALTEALVAWTATVAIPPTR
jgi:cholesterol transport system auxiliary component